LASQLDSFVWLIPGPGSTMNWTYTSMFVAALCTTRVSPMADPGSGVGFGALTLFTSRRTVDPIWRLPSVGNASCGWSTVVEPNSGAPALP